MTRARRRMRAIACLAAVAGTVAACQPGHALAAADHHGTAPCVLLLAAGAAALGGVAVRRRSAGRVQPRRRSGHETALAAVPALAGPPARQRAGPARLQVFRL